MSALEVKELERQLERRDARIISLEKSIITMGEDAKAMELKLTVAVQLHDKLLDNIDKLLGRK